MEQTEYQLYQERQSSRRFMAIAALTLAASGGLSLLLATTPDGQEFVGRAWPAIQDAWRFLLRLGDRPVEGLIGAVHPLLDYTVSLT